MRTNRTHGFTLVELLVVIAIISILASLLLPALARVRDSSYAITCMNLQKQFGAATMFYQNDFDNANPTAPAAYFRSRWIADGGGYWDATPTDYGYWNSWLQQFNRLGYLPMGKEHISQWCCPVYTRKRVDPKSTYNYSDKFWAQWIEYCYGMAYITVLPGGDPYSYIVYKVTRIRNPSGFMMINDRHGQTDTDFGYLDLQANSGFYHRFQTAFPGWVPNHPTHRGITGVHRGNKKLNISFFDGHVGSHGYWEILAEKYQSVK